MANKKLHQPEDHPIDKLFRDGMEDRHFPYDEKYWTEAEKTLAAFNAKAAKGKRNGWWLGGGILVVVVTMITLLTMRHDDDASVNLISNNTTQSTKTSPDNTSNTNSHTEQKTTTGENKGSVHANQEIKHKDTPTLREEMRKKLREKRADKISDKNRTTSNKSSEKQSNKGDKEKTVLGDNTGESNTAINDNTNNKANNTDGADKATQQQSTEIGQSNEKNVDPDPLTPQTFDKDKASTTDATNSNTDAEAKAGNQEGNIANAGSSQTIADPIQNNSDPSNINANPPVAKPDTNSAKPSQFKTRRSSLGLKWHVGLQAGFNHTTPIYTPESGSTLHEYSDPTKLFPTGEFIIGMSLPTIPLSVSTGLGYISMQEKSTYTYSLLDIDTTYDYITDTFGLITDTIMLVDTSYTSYYNETPSSISYLQIPLLVGYEWSINNWRLGIATGPVLGLKLGFAGVQETLLPTIYYNRATWYWKAKPQIAYCLNEHWRIGMQAGLQWQLTNTYISTPAELKFGLQGLQLGIQYDF